MQQNTNAIRKKMLERIGEVKIALSLSLDRRLILCFCTVVCKQQLGTFLLLVITKAIFYDL